MIPNCAKHRLSSISLILTHKYNELLILSGTAWKVSKYGVISGPYFPVFGLNTGKYRPEITPYLDTFHAVWRSESHTKKIKVF